MSYVSELNYPSPSQIPISTTGSTLRQPKLGLPIIRLPSVGLNESTDRQFDELTDAMSPSIYNDDKIDQIISRACQKYTKNLLSVDASENLLESTANDLYNSGDLFNQEQQKRVCHSIVSRFLGVTTHDKMKNIDVISPVEADTPGLYETSGGGQLSKIDYLLKSYEDKTVLLENQIQYLENKLKSTDAASKENAQTCEEALRKLNLNESYLAQIEDTKGDLEVKVGEMKHVINDKEEELRILKTKLTKLEQEFDIQVKNTQNVELKFKVSKDIIEGFEHKVKSLEGKLKLSEDENVRFEEELKIKGGLLDSNSMDLEGSKREVEVLKNKLNKINEDYNVLQSKLTKTGNEKDNNDLKIGDLLLMVKQLQEEQKEKKIDKVLEEGKKEQKKEEFKRKRAMFENVKQTNIDVAEIIEM